MAPAGSGSHERRSVDADNSRVPRMSSLSFTRPFTTQSTRRSENSAWMKMDDLADRVSTGSTGKDGSRTREVVTDEETHGGAGGSSAPQRDGQVRLNGEVGETRDTAGERRRWRPGRKHSKSYSHTHFRVYKRRWFGLAQLVLLNVVVSWDWLSFAPVSTSSAEYFDVSETAINWLSTAFLFAFVVISPVTIWTLNRSPKESIIVASVLLLLGNWIRYAGTKADGGIYGVVMFGQILTGLAQPFVLAAPTRYSDLWFTESGRVSATALASLANPFGGALAQLINPVLGSVPDIILYVSIIATVASIPSFFIPAAPPTPPCASASNPKEPLRTSLAHIFRSRSFYIIALAFAVYVGIFNAFSSLLNQILYPYGYSEDEAGICGAVLIVVGLVAAAITSPIFDRTHAYLAGMKILCTFVALGYLAFAWAPQTRGLPAPYILAAILGASSFSLLPVTLEYLVEITYPASPEVSSTIIWAGGQLLGGIFIVIMTALKDERYVDLTKVREEGRTQGGGDRPPGHMWRALVFQAVIALAVLPFVLLLGMRRLGLQQGEGRLKIDEHREGGSGEGHEEEVL